MKTSRSLLLAISCMALCGVGIRAQTNSSSILPAGDTPLEVRADRHQLDHEQGLWLCEGNVHVSNDRHTLRADYARVNSRTGDVEARGNVEVTQPGLARWTGAELKYNFKTGAGLVMGSTLQAGRLTIQAERGQREADGRTTLTGVAMTSCTNAPGCRHYTITCGQVSYTEGSHLIAQNGVVWMFGLPVAYLPYWYYRLDERFGLDLRPGYTSKWGLFLLSAYDYPILDVPGGAYLDGRIRVDYRAHRGFAFGHALKWDLLNLGKGLIDGYYAHDQDGPDSDSQYIFPGRPEKERGRVAFAHTADLSPRDRVVVQAEWVSDEALLKDFFQNQHRKSAQPDNQASYTRRQDDWAAGVTVSGPLNAFYDGISRTPETWISIMPMEISPGLYYESQSRAGYLLKQTQPQLFWRDAEFEAFRFDTAHRLSMPVTLGDTLHLTPRAGYRGTAYSDAWDKNDTPMRNLFELGAEASLKGQATFGDLRHTVEPYADYSYIAEPKNLEDGDVYSFDRYDLPQEWRDRFGFDGLTAPQAWHGVRLGVRNTMDRRTETESRTLLDSDLYAAYAKLGHDEPAAWRIAGWNLSFAPSPVIRLFTSGEYDTHDHRLRRADAGIVRNTESLRLSLSYLFRCEPPNPETANPLHRPFERWFAPDDRASILKNDAEIRLSAAWRIGFNTRTDLRRSQLQEIGTFVQYSLDCISFRLRTIYQPSMRLEDGSRHDEEFKIALMLTLLTGKSEEALTDLLGW